MNFCQDKEDQNMKHICNICGKQTLTKEKLKQHQNAVHKSKWFKCAECGNRLKFKHNLNQHIRAVHEGVKYPCRQCDHKATSRNHLARHKMRSNLHFSLLVRLAKRSFRNFDI